MSKKTHLSLANRRPWTDDEIETVRLNYTAWPCFLIAHLIDRSESAVHNMGFKLGLEKTEAFFKNPMAHLWNGTQHPASIASRIQKGAVPPNKGKKMPPGWAPGRMAETQFKKGCMAGAAQHNYVPIGSMRLSKDGYLEQKVTDDHPVPARRWVAVHRIVWEQANGPIPAGHKVAFKPDAFTNVRDEITIDRIELVTFAEMMRRNTRHNLPREISLAIQAKAVLTRAINRATREASHV